MTKLDYDPKAVSKQTELIINTLLFLKNNAKYKNALITVSKVLTRMSKFTDLSNSDSVKTYIANAKTKDGKRDLSNSTKSKYVYCYDCLIKAHGSTRDAQTANGKRKPQSYRLRKT